MRQHNWALHIDMEPEQRNAFILDIFIVNEIHIAQLINP